MRKISNVLFIGLFGLIAFLSQVSVDDAASNLGSWWLLISQNGEVPEWLTPRFDNVVTLLVLAALVLLLIGPRIARQFRAIMQTRKMRRFNQGMAQIIGSVSPELPAPSPMPWRIPLTAFFKYAAENGWDFQQESLQIYDLLNGLKQAGFDGVVRFWGRENSCPFPTNENLLVQLPVGYWGTHTVEAISCMTLDDSGNAIGITETNQKIKTEDEFLNDNTGIYADIHLDRAQAEKWLKDETQNYIGKTRARMEARTNPSQQVSRISLAEAARRVYRVTKSKFTATIAEHDGNIEKVYAYAFFRTGNVPIFGRAPSSQVFVQIPKNHLADFRLSDDATELKEDGPKGKRYVDLQINESDLPILVAMIKGQPV